MLKVTGEQKQCSSPCWEAVKAHVQGRASFCRVAWGDTNADLQASLRSDVLFTKLSSRLKETTDPWIKKMWYIYTMEYCSAIKKE